MTKDRKKFIAAVAPFATWIGLQTLLPPSAWAYALRSAATLLALALSLGGIRAAHPPSAAPRPGAAAQTLLGLAGGILVLALWTLPELSDLYRIWCVWPIGSPPAAPSGPSPYSPAVCGWPLTIAKLAGSAFVIAAVEELFFRSFLYRWLQNNGDFASAPLSRFDPQAFAWTALLFTLEHDRPVAAAICAVVYGLLAIRCGLLSAIVAHVTTNLLLGVYVVACGKWEFW